MPPFLNGQWYYQSFVALPAIVDRSKPPPAAPEKKRDALIAAVWTPQTIMELKTDEAGKVTGTADRGVVFKITGSIKPEVTFEDRNIPSIPEGVELVVKVEALSAEYHLRGYFLEHSNHVVGTVVSVGVDPGGQPAGASGPFVLFPVPPSPATDAAKG